MKVKIEISEEFNIPEVVIYTNRVTNELNKLISLLESETKPIIVEDEDRKIVLSSEDIYIVRVEDGETVVYSKDKKYFSKSRLYEIEIRLGNEFMKISKQSIIRLDKLKNVEAGFNGNLFIKLKNGITDTVSRKYIGELKNYLGL